MKKKLTMIAALALAVCIGIGGTLAYLTATTSKITNTFSVGGIEISLKETKKPDGTVVENGVTDWSAMLVPSKEYAKNPVVSVTKNDVECYLFVKFDETNSPDTYLTYTSNLTTQNGWTALNGYNGVWYRTVGANDAVKSWSLLDGDKVTVKANVGSTANPVPAESALPELSYTAYAIQTEGFNGDAAAAFAAIPVA